MDNCYRAGAGCCEVNLPDDVFPLDGFTAVHDNVCVRVVMIEREQRLALVSVDITNIPDAVFNGIAAYIMEKAAIKREHIWVIATHSTGLPHTMVPPFVPNAEAASARGKKIEQCIRDAGRRAADEALASMRDAVICLCRGTTAVNVCRDIPTKDGWWVGLNPDGPSDKTLSVLRIDGLDGNAIAVVYNLGLMPEVMEGSVMQDGGKRVTADLCGAANRAISTALGGSAVAMFCPGASGDQAPARRSHWEDTDEAGNRVVHELGAEGFELVSELGGQLAKEVLRARENVEKIVSGAIEEPSWDTIALIRQERGGGPPAEFRPCRETSRVCKGEELSGFGVWKIGDLTLVGVRPAMTCEVGAGFLRTSPKGTLLFGGVNGAQKCMAASAAYDKIQYGTLNTTFAQGSAEQMVHMIGKRLRGENPEPMS